MQLQIPFKINIYKLVVDRIAVADRQYSIYICPQITDPHG